MKHPRALQQPEQRGCIRLQAPHLALASMQFKQQPSYAQPSKGNQSNILQSLWKESNGLHQVGGVNSSRALL